MSPVHTSRNLVPVIFIASYYLLR